MAAVLAGAATVFFAGRRIGRLAATHREEQDITSDARSALNAKVTVLAGHSIALDRRYARASKKFQHQQRKLAAEYTELVADLTGETPGPSLDERVDSLTDRARALAGTKRGRNR